MPEDEYLHTFSEFRRAFFIVGRGKGLKGKDTPGSLGYLADYLGIEKNAEERKDKKLMQALAYMMYDFVGVLVETAIRKRTGGRLVSIASGACVRSCPLFRRFFLILSLSLHFLRIDSFLSLPRSKRPRSEAGTLTRLPVASPEGQGSPFRVLWQKRGVVGGRETRKVSEREFSRHRCGWRFFKETSERI